MRSYRKHLRNQLTPLSHAAFQWEKAREERRGSALLASFQYSLCTPALFSLPPSPLSHKSLKQQRGTEKVNRISCRTFGMEELEVFDLPKVLQKWWETVNSPPGQEGCSPSPATGWNWHSVNPTFKQRQRWGSSNKWWAWARQRLFDISCFNFTGHYRLVRPGNWQIN